MRGAESGKGQQPSVTKFPPRSRPATQREARFYKKPVTLRRRALLPDLRRRDGTASVEKSRAGKRETARGTAGM
jgi:hypothetical protein